MLQTRGLVFKTVQGYALDRTLSRSSNAKNLQVYQNYRLRRPYTYTKKDNTEDWYSLSFGRDDVLPLLHSIVQIAHESIDFASNEFRKVAKTTAWKMFMLAVAQSTPPLPIR